MKTPGRKNAHPTEDDLLDLADRRLDETRARNVRAHVDDCRRCRRRLDEITALLTAFQGRHLESPPEWLSNWAQDLPNAHPRKAPKAVRSRLRLVFDSLTLEPAGIRSTVARPRRLVFRDGPVDIDVEIEVRPGGSMALRGQVLDATVPGGRVFENGRVILSRGRTTVLEADLSDRGRFQIPGMEPGTYALRIEARGFDCRIPAFEI